MKIQQSSAAVGIHRIMVFEAVDLAKVGLVSVLTAVSRFVVCAATGDFDKVFELVERHRADLLVADPFVNSRDGVIWTKNFVGRFPKTKLLSPLGSPKKTSRNGFYGQVREATG